ncbi:methylated-DNA--protein-cysteine methyltransferase [mine drainage metagenome]|uniref:Methylated-DNA--protein-cysteine methyltransferase n=1 Tax=mine drainage metagenome TaxID=410659 RepID=A0A1J5TNQ3_9ZZZZ
MTLGFFTLDTPVGAFSVACAADESVVATAFGDVEVLARRLPPGTRLASRPPVSDVSSQVAAYFGGALREFSLRLAPTGTAFQHRVWRALQDVPYGVLMSYGELARGVKSSPRAVGRANATNPICLIVPCHRIVGADGSLTGYAFGEVIKRRLIDLERASAPAAITTTSGRASPSRR